MTPARIRHWFSLSVGALLPVTVTLIYLTGDQQTRDSLTFTLCCVAAVACSFAIQCLAFVVDPQTGRTVGEELRPLIADRYAGRPALLGLPAPSETSNQEAV